MKRQHQSPEFILLSHTPRSINCQFVRRMEDVDITTFSHWSCLTRGEWIRTCFLYYIYVRVSQSIHRSLCTPWWMSGCLSYMSHSFVGNLLTMMDVRWLWIRDWRRVERSWCTIRRSWRAGLYTFSGIGLVNRHRYGWFQATAAVWMRYTLFGTDRLSGNVGKILPFYAAWISKGEQISGVVPIGLCFSAPVAVSWSRR